MATKPNSKPRERRNTVGQAAERMQIVARGFERWPESVDKLPSLDDQARVEGVFAQIIMQRREWTAFDTVRASQLALLTFAYQRDLNMLLRTGTLIQGDRKGLKPNPLLYALSQTGSLIAQTAKALGVNVHAQGDLRVERKADGAFAVENRARADAPASGPVDVWEGLAPQ